MSLHVFLRLQKFVITFIQVVTEHAGPTLGLS